MERMKLKRIAANLWYKQKYRKLKKSEVVLSQTAKIDRETRFEGRNIVGEEPSLLGSAMGYMSYVGNHSFLNNCEIGRFCSIGDFVKIISGTHPTNKFVSTHPAFYSLNYPYTFSDRQLFKEQIYVSEEFGVKVKIGNDVWIGSECKILGGVTIGDGAIVAAGAVVTKNVEPYTIVGGIPATKIRKRFSEEQIQTLLDNKWWANSEAWLKDNLGKFSDIDLFLQEK